MTKGHRKLLLLAVALTCAGQTWAINKCVGPDGKVAFQDAPCAGRGEVLDVRPASGRAPVLQKAAPGAADPVSAAPVSKPQSEVERIEAEVAKSQRARRKRDLEVVAIPNARLAIRQHTEACSRQQAQIQSRKQNSANNLAGAVWEQSISEEMSAAARECSTRSRQLVSELDALRQECTAVSCVPEGQ